MKSHSNKAHVRDEEERELGSEKGMMILKERKCD